MSAGSVIANGTAMPAMSRPRNKAVTISSWSSGDIALAAREKHPQPFRLRDHGPAQREAERRLARDLAGPFDRTFRQCAQAAHAGRRRCGDFIGRCHIEYPTLERIPVEWMHSVAADSVPTLPWRGRVARLSEHLRAKAGGVG